MITVIRSGLVVNWGVQPCQGRHNIHLSQDDTSCKLRITQIDILSSPARIWRHESQPFFMPEVERKRTLPAQAPSSDSGEKKLLSQCGVQARIQGGGGQGCLAPPPHFLKEIRSISRGGGRPAPLSESLGIDFYSGFRKKIEVYTFIVASEKKNTGGGGVLSSSIYCSKVNYYYTAVCDVIVRRVHTVQLIDNKNVWCELRTWSRSSTGTR